MLVGLYIGFSIIAVASLVTASIVMIKWSFKK